MGRFLHEQAAVIKCSGATDVGGSGVYQYVIYALRANKKSDGVPNNDDLQYKNKVEIGRISNLNQEISWQPNLPPGDGQGWKIRDYSPVNEYWLRWYGWEHGYNYRFWMVAADQAGNIETPDFVAGHNTSETPVPLVDTRKPQFAVHKGDGSLIEYTSHNKISLKTKWTYNRSVNTFTIDADDRGNSPDWVTGVLQEKLLWTEDNDYEYWYVISANTNEVSPILDTIVASVGIKMDKNTKILSVSTASAEAPSAGSLIIVSKAKLTTNVGIMTIEYEGVDVEIADLDNYEIEKYVKNVLNPTPVTDFDYNVGFVDTQNPNRKNIPHEDIKFIDYNLRWNKDDVTEGGDTDDPANASGFISARGLYKITPVDKYGNKGISTVTWDYTNNSGFSRQQERRPVLSVLN